MDNPKSLFNRLDALEIELKRLAGSKKTKKPKPEYSANQFINNSPEKLQAMVDKIKKNKETPPSKAQAFKNRLMLEGPKFTQLKLAYPTSKQQEAIRPSSSLVIPSVKTPPSSPGRVTLEKENNKMQTI